MNAFYLHMKKSVQMLGIILPVRKQQMEYKKKALKICELINIRK